MKDMGIRTGSGAWAVPVVVTPDTVYVHTDIVQIDEIGGEPVSDLYQYHEVQYGVQEYIELIGSENADLKTKLTETQDELTSTQMALCDVYELIGG